MIGPVESGERGWRRAWPDGTTAIKVTDVRGYGPDRGFAWLAMDERGRMVGQGEMASILKASACAYAVARALGWIREGDE